MLPNLDDVWVSGLVDCLGHGNDIISAANGKLCHTIPRAHKVYLEACSCFVGKLIFNVSWGPLLVGRNTWSAVCHQTLPLSLH